MTTGERLAVLETKMSIIAWFAGASFLGILGLGAGLAALLFKH